MYKCHQRFGLRSKCLVGGLVRVAVDDDGLARRVQTHHAQRLWVLVVHLGFRVQGSGFWVQGSGFRTHHAQSLWVLVAHLPKTTLSRFLFLVNLPHGFFSSYIDSHGIFFS